MNFFRDVAKILGVAILISVAAIFIVWVWVTF